MPRTLLRITFLAALAVGGLPRGAAGQLQQDAPPFAVLALARLDSLLTDPAIRLRTSAKDALELFGAAPPDALARLSDADLKAFLDLKTRSLGRARVPVMGPYRPCGGWVMHARPWGAA